MLRSTWRSELVSPVRRASLFSLPPYPRTLLPFCWLSSLTSSYLLSVLSLSSCRLTMSKVRRFRLFDSDTGDEIGVTTSRGHSSHVLDSSSKDEHAPTTAECVVCGGFFADSIIAAHEVACLYETMEGCDSRGPGDQPPTKATYISCGLERKSSNSETQGSDETCKLEDVVQFSDDQGYYLHHGVEKLLTHVDIVVAGLEKGEDLPLQLVAVEGKGRGVICDVDIPERTFVCEYKTSRLYHPSKASSYEKEYAHNGEGSYIISCPSKPLLCFDATRRPFQVGRFLNHTPGKAANCRPLHPMKVRGKWRVGFISTRAIVAGEELTWDHEEEWLHVKAPSPTPFSTSSMPLPSSLFSRKRPPTAVALQKHPAKRRSKMCPVAGCTAPPLKKLSNHLAQVHRITGKQRTRMLKKAEVATPAQVKAKCTGRGR